MTLPTDIHYECCQSTFQGPNDDAIASWNARNTTVYFSIQGAHDTWNRVHVFVKDVTGNYNLGWAQAWCRVAPPENFQSCDIHTASFYKGHATNNNWAHVNTSGYNNYGRRRFTTAHELGHVLALEEEGDNNYQGYTLCGGGSLPETVMDGRCDYFVKPWDVCGVNHAYYDPYWGWAGC